MSALKGNVMFGQSGGPSAVINSSAAGVFTEALKSDAIKNVYGAQHGIVGILHEDFIDIRKASPNEIARRRCTPASILVSCRYKLEDAEKNPGDYERLLEVFKKYDIRYFFYNGGNDSMDTCDKVSKYLQRAGYECRVVGVPKTIDNDLAVTDHTPGYGSAAKFVATTAMEVYLDSRVYDRGMVIVLEVMGRHAGWLTAATALASAKGFGPELIYLPEMPFHVDQMLNDVERLYTRSQNVMIAVSEGVRTPDGKIIPESIGTVEVDAFGHKQMGGTASVLAGRIGQELGCKVRGIELSLLQRSASHIASGIDIDEAFLAGQEAVRAALAGKTDVMVGFERPASGPYKTGIRLIPLEQVANLEKMVPRAWINEAGNHVLNPFIEYALPLIQGEPQQDKEDSLPRFARFKKIQAGNRDI